jgi:acetyl esterase
MHRVKRIGIRSVTCAAALLALAGCQTGSAYRDPDARLNPDMMSVISAYLASGAQPVHVLSVQQARSQPTLTSAFKTVEQSNQPPIVTPFVKTTDLSVAGAVGPLPARLYDATPGHPGQPIILYFHSGGGVTGDLDSADIAARALATQAHALVLSVAYRLAPEAPLPAALDDGVASYRWLLDNAASLGADPRRIAIGGDGEGGTIAIDTAMAARDMHIKAPVHLLLIEPVVSPDTQTRSEIANQLDVPLSRDDVVWYLGNSGASPALVNDPRIDIIGHGDTHGLPPTTVISAEMDPLDTDGSTLAQKLQVSGVDVARVEYQGTAHGFFGMGAVVARSKEAEQFAAQQVDATFNQIGEPPPPPRYVGGRGGRRRGGHAGVRHPSHRPHGS